MAVQIGKTLRFYGRVLARSFKAFSANNLMTHSAALAYYMVFSFPPMLFIVLWIAARFYREVAMRQALFAEIGDLVGEDGARDLMATIEGLDLSAPTWWATAVGVGAMLFTATTVLVTARNALNLIAGERAEAPPGQGVWRMLWERVISFGMLATVAVILLVSLVVETLVAALGRMVEEWTGGLADSMLAFDYLLLDIAAITVLACLFFRFLPDVRLPWRDTWLGGLVTALLLTAGRSVIEIVIGGNDAAGLYAAAGSVLVLMLWVYYASAIFLFGATFTFTRAGMRRELTEGHHAQ